MAAISVTHWTISPVLGTSSVEVSLGEDGTVWEMGGSTTAWAHLSHGPACLQLSSSETCNVCTSSQQKNNPAQGTRVLKAAENQGGHPGLPSGVLK